MQYSVYVQDYIQQNTYESEKFNTKNNALEYLEDFVIKYIFSKEGVNYEKVKHYREPSHLKSSTWNNYPFGYLICYSTEVLDRLVIYKKEYDRFLLINSSKVTKIFSIQIASKKLEKDNEFSNFCIIDEEYFNHFTEKVIPELLSKNNNIYE